MENEQLQRLIELNDSAGILEFLVSKEYLNSILDIKKELSKRRAGFSLDIDDTLSLSRAMWCEKAFEMFGNPESLSGDEALKKYKNVKNIPHLQNQEFEKWALDTRNNNIFHEEIPLIENSNKIYKEIHENHITISLYITARPETVKNGTQNWLKRHGFPDSNIILKPSSIDFFFNNLWKVSVLNLLYPEIQGIVDDSPKLIKYLPEDYKGIIYMYNQEIEFGKDNIISCLTHEEIKDHIGNIFNK